MTERQATTKAVKPKAPVRRWGLDGDAVLERLQKAVVELKLTDGSTLTGQLVGYSEYQITLKTDREVLLVNKGAVVLLRAVP